MDSSLNHQTDKEGDKSSGTAIFQQRRTRLHSEQGNARTTNATDILSVQQTATACPQLVLLNTHI